MTCPASGYRLSPGEKVSGNTVPHAFPPAPDYTRTTALLLAVPPPPPRGGKTGSPMSWHGSAKGRGVHNIIANHCLPSVNCRSGGGIPQTGKHKPGESTVCAQIEQAVKKYPVAYNKLVTIKVEACQYSVPVCVFTTVSEIYPPDFRNMCRCRKQVGGINCDSGIKYAQ